MQYEISRSTKELKLFHEALFQSKLAHLDPTTVVIAVEVRNSTSEKETKNCASTIVKDMLQLPHVLDVVADTKRRKIILLRSTFLNRKTVNDTLRDLSGMIKNVARKNISMNVLSMHVQSPNTIKDQNIERLYDVENDETFSKTSDLRSLYLKSRLNVLRSKLSINSAIGLPLLSSISNNLKEATSKIIESYKEDEKLKIKVPAYKNNGMISTELPNDSEDKLNNYMQGVSLEKLSKDINPRFSNRASQLLILPRRNS